MTDPNEIAHRIVEEATRDPETAKNYLLDLGPLLREEARKAKQALGNASSPESRAFATGRVAAYYELISLLLDQAKAFGLTPADLRLEGFNVEALLSVELRP